MSAGQGVSLGLVAVLVSAVAWSLGIVYSRKLQPANGSTLNAALPLVCGSLMLLAGGLARGEHHAFVLSRLLPESILGLLFLIFFGSLTAFSAYAWLLKHFDPTLVATHTYVNPIVAVLLGWALAGEKLTGSILLSMGLAILAICTSTRLISRMTLEWCVNIKNQSLPAMALVPTPKPPDQPIISRTPSARKKQTPSSNRSRNEARSDGSAVQAKSARSRPSSPAVPRATLTAWSFSWTAD